MGKQGNGVPGQASGIRSRIKGASPEMRDLLLLADEQGFTVVHTKGNHFKVSPPPDPDGKRVPGVFTPCTPSDKRSLHRVRAKLRRIGVKIPHG